MCVISRGYFTVDLFFFATCMYIVAMYTELKAMLTMLDNKKTKPEFRMAMIKECIIFHTDILK